MNEFIVDNWPAILALIGACLAVARVVAKKSKNKTDDKVVRILSRLVSIFTSTRKIK